jgi:hypothetical protein
MMEPNEGRYRDLSQSFSDQCASCVRRRRDLIFGYGVGFQTFKILSEVGSEQASQSSIPFRIMHGKTLRQALGGVFPISLDGSMRADNTANAESSFPGEGA